MNAWKVNCRAKEVTDALRNIATIEGWDVSIKMQGDFIPIWLCVNGNRATLTNFKWSDDVPECGIETAIEILLKGPDGELYARNEAIDISRKIQFHHDGGLQVANWFIAPETVRKLAKRLGAKKGGSMSSMYPKTAQEVEDMSNEGLIDVICASYFDSHYSVSGAIHALSLCEAELLRRLDATAEKELIPKNENKTRGETWK